MRSENSEIRLRSSAAPSGPLLKRIPNTAFGIPLGLSGHSILWKAAYARGFIGISSLHLNWFFWVSGAVAAAVVLACIVIKRCTNASLVAEEWRHPVRVHFFNAPHLILMMLCLGIPINVSINMVSLRVLWGVSALSQTLITQSIYQRWMFDQASKLSSARPQFLLSTVGWFLLAALGIVADLHSAWGLNLPAFCSGIGAMFYVMVVIAIFNSLHDYPTEKGSPALFLLIAPASVACTVVDSLTGEFGILPSAIFGWCLVLLLLLARIGPTILRRPPVLGVYWAYVFPLAGLATAACKLDASEESSGSRYLAIALLLLAAISLVVVFSRMMWHTILALRGSEVWGDPLLGEQPNEPPGEERLDREGHPSAVEGAGEPLESEQDIEAAARSR